VLKSSLIFHCQSDEALLKVNTPVIRQRCVYTCYHALIRLPEHPALIAMALRKYRSTRRVEQSASECSSDARNPEMQVLCTKLTKPPKPQCGVEWVEQWLCGATRGPKYQGRPLYKRSKGAHHQKGCPRQQRYLQGQLKHQEDIWALADLPRPIRAHQWHLWRFPAPRTYPSRFPTPWGSRG
jgi:hypothetical protein